MFCVHIIQLHALAYKTGDRENVGLISCCERSEEGKIGLGLEDLRQS
jgi:hypothetical protein